MRRAVACWALLAGSLYSQSFYLSNDAIPRKESVLLTIDPARETFDGSVSIDVELRVPASIIWLNARNLTIGSASIAQGGVVRPAKVVPGSGERIGIDVGQPLTGPATVRITYQGRLDDKALTGPYRRKVEGEWYAYTTFAAIEARRAFPCFDEPRFKTPWDISIRVKRENKAFSNGREISETEEPNGWKLVKFATTEPLPSEMVAFAVGPFDVYDGGVAGHGNSGARDHRQRSRGGRPRRRPSNRRDPAASGGVHRHPVRFRETRSSGSARGSLWRRGESGIDHVSQPAIC